MFRTKQQIFTFKKLNLNIAFSINVIFLDTFQTQTFDELVLEKSQQTNQSLVAAATYITNIAYENNNKNKCNIAMNSL